MTSLYELSLALIDVFEGNRLVAYKDTGGIWTIGKGHTKDVYEGMTITLEEEEEFFKQDSAPLFYAVSSITPITRAAALVSFGYNCGIGRLLNVIKGLDTLDNPKHTTDAHGNVLNGLVTRRALELALYNA